MEVVHRSVGHVRATDQEDVAEAIVGDDSGADATSLQHGVQAECRAVDEDLDLGERGCELIERTEHTFPGANGCRRGLAESDATVSLIELDRVDKRSADIDRKTKRAGLRRIRANFLPFNVIRTYRGIH